MMRERRWKEKKSMMRMGSTVEGKGVNDENEKYCRRKRSR
jgi:hypothetical protein